MAGPQKNSGFLEKYEEWGRGGAREKKMNNLQYFFIQFFEKKNCPKLQLFPLPTNATSGPQ